MHNYESAVIARVITHDLIHSDRPFFLISRRTPTETINLLSKLNTKDRYSPSFVTRWHESRSWYGSLYEYY